MGKLLKGISKLNIQDDIFFSENFTEKEKDEILKNKGLIIEEVQWENITISDFMDFIDFSDYKSFHIITNSDSQRLKNIITYIEKETNIEILIVNVNNSKVNLYPYINPDDFKKNHEPNLLLANSYNALHTGFYPTYESVQIKHIFLNDINIFEKLDKLSNSLLENLGFNSLIIIKAQEDLIDYTKKPYFSKIMSFENLKKYNKEVHFENINLTKLKSMVTDFIETGVIDYRKKILSDIGRYLSNKKLSGVFINKEGLYFDFSQNLKLTQNIDTDIYELINYLNNQPTLKVLDDESLKIFFIMHTLVEAHKEKLYFVSHFNKYKYAGISSDIVNEYSNWIGFASSSGAYLYNINTNRTFEVNKDTLILFEKVIKNIDIDNTDQTLLYNLKENLNNEND